MTGHQGTGSVLAALVAACLGATACGGTEASPPPRAEPLVRATADVTEQGRAVPRSFVGFSQDPAIATFETGFVGAGVNPVLVQLYENLTAPGGGPPVLRIGGNGQDSAWWNPARLPRPPGLSIDITPEYLRSVAEFLDASGAKVIFGLNLAADRPALAARLARAAQKVFGPGRLAAFEVGNEPDVYPERTQYADAEGRPVRARPPGYAPPDYLPEFERTAAALRAMRPSPPLAAPGVCCSPWLEALPRLLRREGRDLAMVALHRYPLAACGKRPGQPGYPNAAILLAPDVMEGNVAALAPAVATARRHGLGVRLTETNSVACAGAEKVSDRFVSALWAADWMFNLAAIGMEGVNFHGSSPLYQAFRTGFEEGAYRAIVKPLYYGMLLFAEAAPHGARLLPGAHTGAQVLEDANVQVWATADPMDRVVRVVVINKSLAAGPAEIVVPSAGGTAGLQRLRAPEPLASTGVTWDGRTIPTPTRDGRLQGHKAGERVAAEEGGVFRFDVPAASAALLTVPVQRFP